MTKTNPKPSDDCRTSPVFTMNSSPEPSKLTTVFTTMRSVKKAAKPYKPDFNGKRK